MRKRTTIFFSGILEKTPKKRRFSGVFGPAYLGMAVRPAVRWENTVFAPGWRGIVQRVKREWGCILGEGGTRCTEPRTDTKKWTFFECFRTRFGRAEGTSNRGGSHEKAFVSCSTDPGTRAARFRFDFRCFGWSDWSTQRGYAIIPARH